MSSTEQPTVFAAFTLNSENMSKSAINTVRTTLGISGAIALIIGIFITFWPKTAADVLTVLLAIYFLIAGLAYVGLGIFSKGISGGARALDLILGVLFVIASIVAFANIQAAASLLAAVLGIVVGIVWIIEGVVSLVQSGDAASRGWAIFFGILSLLAGIVLLFSPIWGFVILMVITGISLIVLGIVQIVRAFTFGKGAKTS
ncbi:HdeD family acid-resistance protein [Agromyces sp. Marseille-Q5079]|uniref:HdeD family acid-resistance protein n=1 Tax=Agromyces sp. Marseille-Q5079 TaxID=3439059 RepID=UPI003D9C95E5